MDCYMPNNPQFGISLEYTAQFGPYAHLNCDTEQETVCCESLSTCCPENPLKETPECGCQEKRDRTYADFGPNKFCDSSGLTKVLNSNSKSEQSDVRVSDFGAQVTNEVCETDNFCESEHFSDNLCENDVLGEEDRSLGGEETLGEVNCGADVNEGVGYWAEDMGSFSLPALELEPLPNLFPFSPCSGGYKSGNAGAECRERVAGAGAGVGGGDAADVLLSLKHAVVHGDCSPEPQHSHAQMMMGGGSGYGYYEHCPFPTMSVNVSMNMTMHHYPPEQLCPQVQWNQSTPPSIVYPQSQNMISAANYPAATYSFTADFRTPNQSDPLITASSFKPIQIQAQKPNNGYGFIQKQGFCPKTLSPGLKRPMPRVESPDEQMMNGYGILGHQSHGQEYIYTSCGGGKVQIGALSAGSDDDEQKPNLCRICGKTYARPSTLKTHLRTHSGERPYRCGDCSKSFSQAANLTAHVRTHTGQKPFRCPICDRRFSQSSSVTTHMRTHSGERPYQCRACKKAFSDSSTLTKHLRIHSGEKPYQCKLCLLRFSQSGNLNRHMRVHGNSAPLG